MYFTKDEYVYNYTVDPNDASVKETIVFYNENKMVLVRVLSLTHGVVHVCLFCFLELSI